MAFLLIFFKFYDIISCKNKKEKKREEENMRPILKISFERWKFNEEYQVWVSTYGRIRNKDKSDYEIKTGEGYCWYYSKERREQKKDYIIPIHRLVMLTWRPINTTKRMTVDHLDHNKRNNHISNLAWITPEENVKKGLDDSIVFNTEFGNIPHTEFRALKEQKKQQNIAMQTKKTKPIIQNLLVTVTGSNWPNASFSSIKFDGTESAIITTSKTLENVCSNEQFSRSKFSQYCRDIINEKNGIKEKTYFGLLIKGVK